MEDSGPFHHQICPRRRVNPEQPCCGVPVRSMKFRQRSRVTGDRATTVDGAGTYNRVVPPKQQMKPRGQLVNSELV